VVDDRNNVKNKNEKLQRMLIDKENELLQTLEKLANAESDLKREKD
jgi:hypothetical protein